MKIDFKVENELVKKVVYDTEKKIIEFMRINNKTLWNLSSEKNKDNDKIYTYDYGGIDGELRELRVIGLRILDNEDSLGIIGVPLGIYDYDQTWTDDELVEIVDKCDDEDCEYTFDYLFGGELLGWFTALNLAEVLDEYEI